MLLNLLTVTAVVYFIDFTVAQENPFGTNTSNKNASGGIQLAAFHIEEFELYFAILISLIVMCLFKMYYPKVPYVPEYLPESLLLIVIGVCFGAILSVSAAKPVEETVWKLTPGLFFHFLLPPIVLDAAYSLYNRTFLDYLGSILVYAVVGTVLNFLIIGPVMYGLYEAGAFGGKELSISLNSFLLFSSLIVAVDPVAVLAIFQDIGVEPGLYYMVFGESLLNDAVTVVLYRIMSEFVNVTIVTGADIGLGIGSFFTISIGGLIVGVVFGVVSSFFTRWKTHFGPIFMIMMAYFSYIMGETLGWSGIISMIGCGLVQADYAFHNISASSLTTLRKIIKQISEISEGFIFFLIGIQLFSAEIRWDTGFCLWGLVACLVARTLVTLVLSLIINKMKMNDMKITMRQQLTLIYGGLRGAVAFSLALLVDFEELGNDGKEVRKIIVTATLFIILITVGLMGITMKPLVKFFHVKLAEKESLSIWADLNRNTVDHTLAGVEAIVGSTGRNRVRQFFARLDDKYIRHFLQREPETHDEKIIKTYERIALKLHFASIHPEQSSTHLEALPETLRRQHLASSESQVHLQALIANMSDPRLHDYFAQKMQSNDSIASLESLNKPVTKVTFDDESKAVDGERSSVNPAWRKRTSLVDQGKQIEEFQETYLGMMKRKSKWAKFQRRVSLQHQNEETRANTEKNRASFKDLEYADGSPVTQTSTVSKSDSSPIPPKDYPSQTGPKFNLGGEYL